VPVSPANNPAAGKLQVTSPRQKTDAPKVQKKDGGQAAVPAVAVDSPAIQPDVLHRETVHQADAL